MEAFQLKLFEANVKMRLLIVLNRFFLCLDTASLYTSMLHYLSPCFGSHLCLLTASHLVNDPFFSLSLDKKDALACITEEPCPRIATGRLPLCHETNVGSESASLECACVTRSPKPLGINRMH
ncbi:Versiconal hemiacetal acetate reductase [Fusarium oxysporum f. sp. albedinis]|nr:Versiconal hemiacetal acetate reductase [Fusarium oxysporum f. sp. albedinis]